MEKSETIGKLAESLAIAQGKIKGALKDSENPFFKSKYADLASVWEACREPLSANGLAVVQTTEPYGEDGAILVETLLAHSSGEWICGHLKVTPVRDDPQGMGSAITYARRYALAAIVGVAPEDDDGNAASHPSDNLRQATKTAPKPNTAERTALKKAAVDACKLLNEAGDEPKWTATRLDEFSIQEYGTKADMLELEPLRELVEKLSKRLDDLKKGTTETDKKRADLIAAIKSEFAKPEDLQDYLDTRHIHPEWRGKKLEEMSLDTLLAVDKDTSIPF